jgi:hypothetical protein
MYGRPYKNLGTSPVIVNNIYINGELKESTIKSRKYFIESFNNIDDDLTF